MTKQDFNIIRAMYRARCKRLWRMYLAARDDGRFFYENAESREAFETFWKALEAFAECANISPAAAADVLNLK